MGMPGFTAETSLYQTSELYRLVKGSIARSNMLREGTYLPMVIKTNSGGDAGGGGGGGGIPAPPTRAQCLANARSCILGSCVAPFPGLNCGIQALCLDTLEGCLSQAVG